LICSRLKNENAGSESFAVLACDVAPPRVASGCAGALSGADARCPSGGDSSATACACGACSSRRSDLIPPNLAERPTHGGDVVITVGFARCYTAFNARDLEGSSRAHACGRDVGEWVGGWLGERARCGQLNRRRLERSRDFDSTSRTPGSLRFRISARVKRAPRNDASGDRSPTSCSAPSRVPRRSQSLAQQIAQWL